MYVFCCFYCSPPPMIVSSVTPQPTSPKVRTMYNSVQDQRVREYFLGHLWHVIAKQCLIFLFIVQ